MSFTDLVISVAAIIAKSPHAGVQAFASTLRVTREENGLIPSIVHLSDDFELHMDECSVRLMTRHEGEKYVEHKLLAVLDFRNLSDKHFENKLAALIHLTQLPQPLASGSIYYLTRPL